MLGEVLEHTESLDSSSATVVVSMLYDIAFNIHNHDSPSSDNPLASVMHHEAEHYRETSGLYRSIERYYNQRLNDRFGISLTEYWELPRYVVDMMTDIVIESSKKNEDVESDVERQVEREMKRTRV